MKLHKQDISAVTVILAQNQAITLAPSQEFRYKLLPTYTETHVKYVFSTCSGQYVCVVCGWGDAAVVLHLTNWGYKSQGEVKRCAETAVTLCTKEKRGGGGA